MALTILRVMASLVGLALALAVTAFAVCVLATAIFLSLGEMILRRVWP